MPKGKENVKYDRLRGKDKHKYEMMFAIRKALEKSNNWSEFQKKLSRDKIHFTIRPDSKGKSCGIVFSRGEYTFSGSRIDRSLSYFKIANMLIKYENNLDISDSLGNTQQDKIQEQEKDTVTPAEHEEIYENDITSPTGNSIINAVADLLLQPNAVITVIYQPFQRFLFILVIFTASFSLKSTFVFYGRNRRTKPTVIGFYNLLSQCNLCT